MKICAMQSSFTQRETSEKLNHTNHLRKSYPHCYRRQTTMVKGYPVPDGFMGWLKSENKYQLFATENDYLEYILLKEDAA